jgi:hypothetical protein
MKRSILLPIILILTSGRPARAEETTLPQTLAVPWTAPTGQGIGIGYDNGLYGSGFGQGLRLKVPFGRNGGVTLRGIMVVADDPERWSAGGRLEVYGQSPVFLNLMRLYGGGGVQMFHLFKGEHAPSTQWGGGGQFGFEFFMAPHLALFLEVGGNGNAHLVGGATVVAGINFYPR